MKEAIAEIWEVFTVDCPYCEKSIEEYWGAAGDMTVHDYNTEGTTDCPKCHKTFEYTLQ